LGSLILCESYTCRQLYLANDSNRYWSRKFRKHMELKRSGRMTTIPQLGPEVFVDDENSLTKQAKVTVSPFLSPSEISDPRSSFITHGLDGAARFRSGSLGAAGPASPGSPGIAARNSPQLSPHRPSNSAFSFEGEQLSPAGSAHSSRRGSAVNAENVLEVLDNSAWGESIRRSFTMRRPSRGEHS
jgi:voltage-dependent calcium channel